MHVAATPEQAGTILGAMLAIASSGGTPTEADRASIATAGRYIFKLDLARDLAGVTPPGSEALRELAADPAIADEAVRFATVMAFIDGRTLDPCRPGRAIPISRRSPARFTRGRRSRALPHCCRRSRPPAKGAEGDIHGRTDGRPDTRVAGA
jgi:hypothetical protein